MNLWESYRESQHRYLEAIGRSSSTVHGYRLATEKLEEFCVRLDPPIDNPALVRREHIIGWLQSLREPRAGWPEGYSGKYIHTLYLAVHSFYAWLIEDGELADNPARGLNVAEPAPKNTEVLSYEQIKRIMAFVRTYHRKWNVILTATFRIWLDTGMRHAELDGLTIRDYDPKLRQLQVLGKGDKWRVVPIGHKTVRAIEAVIRQRGTTALDDRLIQVPRRKMRYLIARIGRHIGIVGLHPHIFRHTFAHHWLAAGGGELDLMRICGWTNHETLKRYTNTLADDRAQAAHEAISPGDKF